MLAISLGLSALAAVWVGYATRIIVQMYTNLQSPLAKIC